MTKQKMTMKASWKHATLLAELQMELTDLKKTKCRGDPSLIVRKKLTVRHNDNSCMMALEV